jgi:hypothetical protein
MSYYLIDIDTELDFSKLIIGNTLHINDDLQKVYIYYMDETPKEIYIKIPPLRLIYNYKNLKFNQIKLPIYPNWDKTKKFVKLIKKLEKFIRLNVNCENAIFVNSIEKNNNISSIKLNIPTNLKINSVISTSLADLKINGEIECIINISYVWLKKNSYGLSLSCYQLRYNPRVEEKNIDFFDPPSRNIVCKDINIVNKNINIVKSNIIESSQLNVKPLMFISSSILNDAIIKLNRTKNN